MSSRNTLTTTEVSVAHRQRLSRLATSDENGSPQLVRVCYAFDGMPFYTPLDEKPKSIDVSKLRRVRNIEARHEAALLIDQYSDDWSQLGYLLVRGKAELIPPGHNLHAHALLLLRTRYAQYRSMALEQYPVIMLTPAQISSWGPALAAR